MQRLFVVLSLCTVPWWVVGCVTQGTVREEAGHGGREPDAGILGDTPPAADDSGDPSTSPWVEEGRSGGILGDGGGVATLGSDGLVAQPLGAASGAGEVDVLDGDIAFVAGEEGWEDHDVDVYAFTVREMLGVSMLVVWADTAMDLDAWIFADVAGDGTLVDLFHETYCATADNPEQCSTGPDIVLAPDQTYYLTVAGYVGAGLVPYHVELAWFAP